MLHKRFNGFFADLERELKNLEAVVTELQDTLQNVSGKPNQIVIRACASILHDFYTGIEKTFARIATEIDGGTPRGYDRHLQLLRRMLTPISDVRPQVIDIPLGEELDEYLRFRHMFRHQSGFHLKWPLVKDLTDHLPDVHQRFAGQIRALMQWLQTIDRNDKLDDSS